MVGQVRPLARSRDLIVEEVNDEVLLYDENSKTAHCLSTEAARVWRACDGRTTIDALTAGTGLDEDTVTRALADLQSRALLQEAGGGGLTRRDLTKKAAKVGAAAAAVPLIVSINPAVAEATMTPTPEQCAQYNAASCSGCDEIVGCCCCCQASGGGTNACKLCFPESTCSSFDCNLGVDKVRLGHCTGGGQPTCSIGEPGCECENLVPAGQEGTCGCTYTNT